MRITCDVLLFCWYVLVKDWKISRFEKRTICVMVQICLMNTQWNLREQIEETDSDDLPARGYKETARREEIDVPFMKWWRSISSYIQNGDGRQKKSVQRVNNDTHLSSHRYTVTHFFCNRRKLRLTTKCFKDGYHQEQTWWTAEYSERHEEI